MLDLSRVKQDLNRLSLDDLRLIADRVLDFAPPRFFIPNIGPQTMAYLSEADEMFYGGAAGGGKTSLICALAVQEHSKSLILRRTFPRLSGIFDEVARITGSRDGLKEHKKIWDLGRERRIDFGSVQHEKDKEDYQGKPHDFIAFDEITQFTRSQYEYICGWNRSADPNQRCRTFVTGNPPMSSEGMWVKEHWAAWLDPLHPNPAKNGELRWYTVNDNGDEIECDGPDHIPDGCSDKPRSRTFIQALLEDNPEYMLTGYSSVLAKLPEPMRSMLRKGRFDVDVLDSPFQVIPSVWILEAQKRWREKMRHYMQMDAVGVDVAQGGRDKTVIARRHGNFFDNLISIDGRLTPDGPTVAAHVMRVLRDSARVVVDAGGGYGGDTMTQLMQAGPEVYGFNGAGRSQSDRTNDGMHEFVNNRAMGYWRLREALNPDFGENIALPADTELFTQLSAPLFEITPSGIKIESKADIIKRLGVSPDKADAVVYAYMSHHNGLSRVSEWRDRRKKKVTNRQTSYSG